MDIQQLSDSRLIALGGLSGGCPITTWYPLTNEWPSGTIPISSSFLLPSFTPSLSTPKRKSSPCQPSFLQAPRAGQENQRPPLFSALNLRSRARLCPSSTPIRTSPFPNGRGGKGAPRTSQSSPTFRKRQSSTRSKAPPRRRPLSSSISKAPPP